jgi:aminoglycoside 3-N-acetyltransferase
MPPAAGRTLPSVTSGSIKQAIDALRLAGRPVGIHASLRSFGWVAGGPATVVEAFLSAGCTVLVPAFTSSFGAPPPAGWFLAQNACELAEEDVADPLDGPGRGYTPDVPDVDENMGAIPAAVLAMPGRRRGDHPSGSFAAVGPLAGALIDGQSPLDQYAPLRALAALDGAVVLMGLGLRKMTLLHLAEAMAGRRAFRRWARGSDGRPIEVETGSCSKGFPNLEAVLRPLAQAIDVGHSHWSVYPAAATLDAAAAAIAAAPGITHCGGAGCRRCDDAVRGGPLVSQRSQEVGDRSTPSEPAPIG